MTRTPTGAATYPTINTVGALLPPDLLSRLAAGELDHLTPGSYGLPDGFTLRQAAARAWELLLPTYRTLQQRLAALSETDPATGLTRDRWTAVLFRELGYDLTEIPNITIDGDIFDIRHLDGHVPVHMLGWNVDLDKRAQTHVRGASRTAPHSLVQELLNRTDEHMWAILTNGRRLRLLRDNVVMGRPAYVEFDLEGMFSGEQFADFAVMFALAHATRLRSTEPAECILEQWRTTAINEGTRALEHLRDGVVDALRTLGNGFLEHSSNAELRNLLKQDHGATNDYYRWLLRLVYRLIFLFVAEDRDLLHPTTAETSARARYRDYFSTQHLRELAIRRRAGRHSDLWQSLRLVFSSLGSDGQPSLGLPAYGSDLFNPGFVGALERSFLTNQRLLGAIRALSQLPDRATGTIRPVDYKNLGAEELGSVYEALLEYVPAVESDGTFTLAIKGGNARKTSGSYYTPTELVELVLDEALEPILNERAASEDPEGALLDITVCDPACGSGHFLVAAARRIAKRLASARTGDPEPTPEAVRDAMHDVVGRCIYGVDLSDLAAELAKVSLWLESLTPGQPLAFLDAHIKVGNGLIGATPALLAENVPDIAFAPLEGDDDVCDACAANGIADRISSAQAKRGMTGCTHPKWSAIVKAANKAQRQAATSNQDTLLGLQQVRVANSTIARAAVEADGISGADISSIRAKADAWRRIERDPSRVRAKQVADAWTAAFFWPLNREHGRQAPTHDVLLALQEHDDPSLLQATRNGVARLARQHRFFHWHLEFPHIFKTPDAQSSNSTGWEGGFTCVIGNPPWERLKVQDAEFFEAAGRPDIVNARTAADRRKLLARLPDEDPDLFAAYRRAVRDADAQSHFVRTSGVFPLAGQGDVNTFQVFAEQFTTIVDSDGRSGIITPTAIATGSTTAAFFSHLVEARRLSALYDFENEARIFAGVHHAIRFCVLAASGIAAPVDEARFAFLVRHLRDLPNKRYQMAPDEILLINPNTGTCPTFHSRRDAEIVLGMYRRHPVLWRDEGEDPNPWGLRFSTMFHMSNDADKFRSATQLNAEGAGFDGYAFVKGEFRWLPLYEGKMFGHFDHRYATYENATPANIKQGTLPRLPVKSHDEPDHEVHANHWIAEREVVAATPEGWDRDWHLAWRNITGATVYRTLIPSVIPAASAGNSVLFAHLAEWRQTPLLLATWSSIAADYIARQKLSGSNFVFHVMKQIAVPHPKTFGESFGWTGVESLEQWLLPRVLELVYTSRSVRGFAEDMGDAGEPFRWLPARRAILQAELDAAMCHVYGLSRDEVLHILDSFRVMRESEERDLGEYRTRRLVVDAYDSMTEASASGREFLSPLDPAPGCGPRHS